MSHSLRKKLICQDQQPSTYLGNFLKEDLQEECLESGHAETVKASRDFTGEKQIL